MEKAQYLTLSYEHKLLYVREVFHTCADAHPVYAKMYTLLSGQWKLEEKHLDMLFEEIHNLTENVHDETMISKMSALAAQLEYIQRMEAEDRAREAGEIVELEDLIMAIDDDRPSQKL